MGNHYDHGFLDYPIYAFTENYSHGHIEDWHSHERIQLIHTLSGVPPYSNDRRNMGHATGTRCMDSSI